MAWLTPLSLVHIHYGLIEEGALGQNSYPVSTLIHQLVVGFPATAVPLFTPICYLESGCSSHGGPFGLLIGQRQGRPVRAGSVAFHCCATCLKALSCRCRPLYKGGPWRHLHAEIGLKCLQVLCQHCQGRLELPGVDVE